MKAASKAFSVAPTDTLGKVILFPFKPFFASAIINPFFILIFAPNFFNAKRCKSTGLEPIAHPPGSEILAFLYLANNGPKTKTPALIVFTNLYGAIVLIFLSKFFITIILLFLKIFIFKPINFKSFAIVKIS